MRSLVVTVLASTLLAGTADPATVVFTVGVLRRDAIIVPLATYDGKEWKNYWPRPSGDVDIPMNLRSVPKKWWGPMGPLDTWQVWAGPQPQTVHVRQPDWLDTYCQKQVGLRTDYQPRVWPPPADTQPYPKDGLAVSPPQPIQPIERVATDSSEAAAVQAVLRDGYAVQQERAIARAEEQGADVHPDRKTLDALPITIESLYATGTAARRVYWVESNREYKNGGSCGAVLFGAGWLVFQSGKLSSAAFNVDMVPCHRQTLLYMLPLGVMSLPTGVYWIAQWSGWEREAYGVFDIGQKDIEQKLAVAGGSCTPG